MKKKLHLLVFFGSWFMRTFCGASLNYAPDPIDGGVNVVTGQYIELESDLQLSGAKAFSLKRWIDFSGESNSWQFNVPNLLNDSFATSPSSLQVQDTKICYAYNEKGQIDSIEVRSKNDAALYHTISFCRPNATTLEAKSHDQLVTFFLAPGQINREGASTTIEKIQKPNGIVVEYSYLEHPQKRIQLIAKRIENGTLSLENTYYDGKQNYVGSTYIPIEDPIRDFRIGRVKTQKISLLNESLGAEKHFFYFPGRTEVIDTSCKAKRIYTYLSSGKISSIEHMDASGPTFKKVKKMRFMWKETGKDKTLQLAAKCLEDSQNRIVTATVYEYDSCGLLVKETLYGCLFEKKQRPSIQFSAKGTIVAKDVDSCSTSYSYQKMGEAYLLAQKVDPSGLVTKYCYEAGTDRIKSVFLGDKNRILLRQFIAYDSCGNPIETIVDDGTSENDADTSSVTTRKRTSLALSQEQSTYGLPLVITESEYTKKDGEVVHTVYNNTYSSAGKLSCQKIEHKVDNLVELRLWQYDSHHRLVRFENEEGVRQYHYGAEGFLQWESLLRKKEGACKKLCYDVWGRVALIEEKLSATISHKTHYSYNSAGYLEKTVDSFGNATRYKTDIFGNVLEKTLPAVIQENHQLAYPKETYIYDDLGNCVCSIDPLGYQTSTVYNCLGKVLETHFADGSFETYTYSSAGHILNHKDRTGTRHAYCYDVFGRKTEERTSSPSGHTNQHQTYEYEGFSLSICKDLLSLEVIDFREKAQPLNFQKQEESLTPQASARLDAHTNELGIEVGKVTWIYPNGAKTVQILDSAQRPQLTYQYDPLGMLIKKETQVYDLAGNLAFHSIDHYDKKGSKREFAVAYARGPLGRIEVFVEAPFSNWARVTSYRYNDQGQIACIVKPDGISVHLSYTEEGKVASVRSSDGSIDYKYLYNKEGQLASTVDAVQAYRYSYEYPDSSTCVEHYPQGYFLQKSCKDAETTLTLSDNSSINYRYSNDRLLSAIDRVKSNGESYTINYDAYTYDGKPLLMTLPFALNQVRYAYEENGGLKEIASSFYQENLFHNLGVWMREVTDFEEKHTFTYETNWQNYITSCPETKYEYDSSGDRLYVNGKELLYNPLGQLLFDGESNFTYDENGNVLSLRNKEASYRFSYDAFNRLAWVHLENVSYRYIYDAYNRRIQKQEFQDKEDKRTLISEEHYLYDGMNEIACLNNNLEIVQLRILGVSPEGRKECSVAIEIEGKPYIPLQDITGSICRIIDPATKETVEKMLYTPFGKELSSSVSKLSPWRFADKRCDFETRLTYFGFRYLLPDSGRWLTTDPAGFLDGPNRYLFAHNNPFQYRDAYGLLSISGMMQASFTSLYNTTAAIQSAFSQLYYSLDMGVSYLRYIQPTVSTVFEEYFGKGFLAFAGFYAHAPEVGVFGHGEIAANVRVTCLNGIGNLRYYYKGFLEQLSNSHGGTNVHYIFHPTEGYTRDVLQAVAIRFGWVSPYAHTLATTWKRLIKEMGGVAAEGAIYHYCHSLGGGDTMNAVFLLTPEERQMIHVFSFGAPVLITDGLGLGSFHNYVGVHDPVPIFDPIGLVGGTIFPSYHLHRLGGFFEFPLLDHAIDGPTYGAQIAELGQQFIERYFSKHFW